MNKSRTLCVESLDSIYQNGGVGWWYAKRTEALRTGMTKTSLLRKKENERKNEGNPRW